MQGERISTVWIDSSVLASILKDARKHYPYETGGCLLGYFSGASAIIEAMIGAGPKAIHKRTGFSPNHDWQEKQIAKIYKSSNRLCTYLGDWHSHPDGPTMLSPLDKVVLKSIAFHSEARAERPLMLIVSPHHEEDFGVWRTFPSRNWNSIAVSRCETITY